MRAIDFVARRGMGVVERGTVAADAAETVVGMGSGVEFSLNLQPGDMQAYSRQGNDLEIVLADGRVLILDGYFAGSGENPNRLFISSGGTLNEVSFIEGADGALFAQYGTTAEWGKWSPDDDLIFVDDPNLMAATGVDGDQDVSMLGAGLLRGAGLLGGGAGVGAGALAAGAAGAALLATNGDGETDTPTTMETPTDDGTRKAPTINGTGRTDSYGGDTLTAAEKSVTVSGTAEAGSSVTINVGSQSQVVTADSNGNWSGTFDGASFPADGTYTTNVTVVEPGGITTTLVGQSLDIDTTPPAVDPTQGTLSSGDQVNAASYSTGTIEVAGTGEAGSSIDVTIDGTTHSTTVDANGNWSVDFASAEITGGERTADVVIKTTDGYGNSHTQTESMVIDTIAPVMSTTSGTGSAGYTVNHTDMTSDGKVEISGSGEAGADYRVELGNGAFRTGTIDANGQWSAEFTQAEMGGMSGVNGYTVPVTFTSTDSFGNPSVVGTDTIHVDTLTEVGISANVSGGNDHVASHAETAGGTSNLVLTGTSEPGTTSVVVAMNGNSVNAVVDPLTGNWTASFAPGTYSVGTHTYPATAVSTDAAGNTASTAMSVRVDTEVTNLSASNVSATGTDNVVGLDDADGGITLTGTMEANWADVAGTPGVVVNFNGRDYTATVNPANGQWSVDIPEDRVPSNFSGDYNYTVTGTDSVGNTQTLTQSIAIDTVAPDGIGVTCFSADCTGATNAYEDFDVETTTETMGVARVEANGTITDLVEDTAVQFNDYGMSSIRGISDQVRIELDAPMSNGESLVLTETDAAGNSSGTLVMLGDGTTARDVSNANLGSYDIETIELGVMDNTQLTLTEADIVALSGNSNSVAVRGGVDDAVDITGAVPVPGAGATVNEGGVDYNVYTLGSTTIYIEDEITNVTTI